MKNYLLLLSLLVFGKSYSQLAPFTDYNRYFKTFYKNSFRQLEFQQVKSFDATDNLIAYIDARGDFKVYNGESTQTLTNQNVSYKISDAQLAWNIGPTLFSLNKDKKELITTFGNNYETSDSLIVYEDTRFNTVSVKIKSKIIQLYQVTGDLYMPTKIGDNTVVFKDNSDFYKIYWNEKIFDYAVYTRPIEFSCGMNVVCFNDPINQTFAVFDKGEILDVEPMFVKKHRAARNFVAYEDQQGNLWYYSNGQKEQLSNFSVSDWNATDDIVYWNENNIFYAYVNGEKKKICSFIPKDYKVKNNTIVYRNNMGGISIFADNKTTELTNQLDCTYSIYGNTVLVELFNKSFLVYNEGKIFEY
ncbi:MAG: hypothetical protein V4622_01595 [Bacteroidota bacterium]